MRFFPEKLLAESSYQPPTRLFEDGRILDVVVAGEPVQVAPNRTDTSDSVAFYFPRHRLVITNMMVTGAVFNIYTLRGGAFRDPANFINDARWVESKNAEILLDIHGPTLKGEKVVHEGDRALRRPGATHPRSDLTPDRPWHGCAGGGRSPLHAAPSARGT
jgi:alkyl sulfatase BDS1-like metallo-beta-lactamase superfamily hydrolase